MNEPKVLLIETPVHGRVLHVARDPERLLIGFHGYGESAEMHLAELERIYGGWSLAAVQALHPFYARDQSRVVASWMTRLDREPAIADNIEYVRRAVAALTPARLLVFAGFSQGVATAWRAASVVRCDGVIAVGGDLPPELVGPFPPALVCRGVRDEWYTAEKMELDLARLPKGESCVYEAGHELSDEVLGAAARFLTRVSDSAKR